MHFQDSVLAEQIDWTPVHGAIVRLDSDGHLVLSDSAVLDWNLLRHTDARFDGALVKLTVVLRPTSECSTCFYVHHWGGRDVCSIDKDGAVVVDDGAESIDVSKLAEGFLEITVIFQNDHPTLQFGTGGPRGQYEGTGRDQYVFRSVKAEIVSRSPIRKQMIGTLFQGVDPFRSFPGNLIAHDLQGWNSQHAYLAETIDSIRPSVILEVGVWKGASTIFMANELKKRKLPSVVIAVDTWLGSSEHWSGPSVEDLGLLHGRPSIYYKFLSNVIREHVSEYVLPLPMDSLNAAEVLKNLNIRPWVIHLDGGHDYESVMADLRVWWPLLVDGGVLVGDDYFDDGKFPGVRQAFDEYFSRLRLMPIEHKWGKCRVAKPA